MRILHMFTNPELTNGASIFEFRISQILYDKNIIFDYLFTKDFPEEDRKQYEKMGSKLYKLPIKQNYGIIWREINICIEYYRFFKTHNYDVVYADTENPLRAVHLFMARMAGVKIRVVHSHNTSMQNRSHIAHFISRLLRKLFLLSATDYFACSEMAAEWLFPSDIVKEHKYKILRNGVETDKFKFNAVIRGRYQKQLGIDGKFVIGHVGRFVEQKNHSFLIDLFSLIYNENRDARLLLIGEGKLESDIRKKVKDLGLNNAVIFLGNVPNVNEYMQTMDVFVMPSIFEGLPIVGIEAQAAGIPCIFSDVITTEVRITDLVEFLSLSVGSEAWSNKLMKYSKADAKKDTSSQIYKAGFSIESTAEKLERFYANVKIDIK